MGHSFQAAKIDKGPGELIYEESVEDGYSKLVLNEKETNIHSLFG